ncbi:MAG TPA: cyclic-phosphate processing receiver domain-containing protein [Baekduia sp.]|nr:cyclic-phosphate processing receiver domain-containing protein [Baekduia sp.]
MSAHDLAVALWRRRDPALLPGAEALLHRLPDDDRDRRRLRWELEATRAHRRLMALLPLGRPVRVWLDDDLEDRAAPSGWVHVTTAWEAMALLTGWPVVEASFDHDLGDDARNGRGIDALAYLEELEIGHGVWRWPARITLHSANGAGRDAMVRLVRSAGRRCAVHEERTPGGKPRFRMAAPEG